MGQQAGSKVFDNLTHDMLFAVFHAIKVLWPFILGVFALAIIAGYLKRRLRLP
jgi:hypothetical protein